MGDEEEPDSLVNEHDTTVEELKKMFKKECEKEMNECKRQVEWDVQPMSK